MWLDGGWFEFESDIWSQVGDEYANINAGETYTVTGSFSLAGTQSVTQSSQLYVHYYDGSTLLGEPVLLVDSSDATSTLDFVVTLLPPPDTTKLKFASTVHMQTGSATYSLSEISRRQPGSSIQRSTYYLAGKAIATRINGTTNDDGLYFFHSDHLGSATVMSDDQGVIVPDSTARYLPFGDWRTEPTANLTELGYTGHHQNNFQSNDLGLIYMNARFYVSGVYRFASADTIVPDPTNPQDLNRYSYVRNNPLLWIDPTGHILEEGYGGSGTVGCETSTGGANCVKVSWDEETAAMILDTTKEIVGTAAGMLWEPADWAMALADGFQWHDSLGMLPLIPSAFGDEIGGFVARHWDEFAAAISRRYGKYADEALDAARRAFGMTCSFSADTLVMTEDGMKPISEVELDELVWAYNEETGEMDWYPVVAVWAHEDPITVYLTIDGEIIETTPEHPFFTAEGEWLPAASLQVGDEIRNAKWVAGIVEAIEFVHESQTMYNFTVATAHTYFVGEEQWLVHNSCGNKSIFDQLVDHSFADSDDAMEMAMDFLGEYDEIAPDVFRSKHAVDFEANGNPIFAQVRMTNSDLAGHAGGPSHFNFELWIPDPRGGWISVGNKHVNLTDP